MVIFNAERFGLAQLHQLRGRIGRGEHKELLRVGDGRGKIPKPSRSWRSLRAPLMGFRLPRKICDCGVRERFWGTRQSGAGGLRFVEYLADTALIREAREVAEELLADDPGLVRHQHLKHCLTEQADLVQS